ncbi:hypothetical protein HY772_10280 [Candidatus Woesearchaeota archaeon]|nr:hypothetical protein [Candidatus Woesearchaeota archaeon]
MKLFKSVSSDVALQPTAFLNDTYRGLALKTALLDGCYAVIDPIDAVEWPQSLLCRYWLNFLR